MKFTTSRNRLLIAIFIIILAILGVVAFLLLRQAPGTSVSVSDHNDGICVIGWANSHRSISSTTPSSYLPYQTVDSAKPAGATMKVFDLDANAASLTAANLANVDILFVVDQGDNNLRTNYVNPTAAQLNIIDAEFKNGMHVYTVSDNAGSAPNTAVSYAAMMGRPVINKVAAGIINFADTVPRIIQSPAPTGTTSLAGVDFLTGLPYNAVGSGFWTPGELIVSGTGKCAVTVNKVGGGTLCMLAYVPKAGSNGFVIADTNGGVPSRALIPTGKLWEQVADCAPEPPPQCGNSTVETGEECDGGNSNGLACVPNYGATCSYCTSECKNATIPGPFCGDGIKNGTEACDNTDVAEGAQCTATCTIVDPLSIEKSSVIQSISSQEAMVQYTVTVTNPNTTEIIGKVIDQLPSFVQAADVTAISNAGVFDATAKTITWDPLTIPASGNIALTYILRVTAANYGTITNTAVVYDSEGSEDDRAVENVTLDADTQITVNKSHTQQTTGGTTVATYTVAIHNLGTTQLVNLTATDTLGNNILPEWVGNISNSGTLTGNVITWTGLNINSQATTSLTYTVSFPSGTTGTFGNTVVVTDPQNEELGRDTDSITLTVQGVAPPTDLPDTALFDDSYQFVLMGIILIILGALSYKFHIGEGIGRVILGFAGERIQDVKDSLNPSEFEVKAERSLKRKISRQK